MWQERRGWQIGGMGCPQHSGKGGPVPRGNIKRTLLVVMGIFGATSVFAASHQNHQGQARAAAERVAEAYLADLQLGYDLPQNSAFQKTKDVEASNHFCWGYAQTYFGYEILGRGASVCFAPDGKLQDKGEAICDGACLKNSTQSLMTDGDAMAVVEGELGTLLGKDFGRVEKRSAVQMWGQVPGERGIRAIYRVTLDTVVSGNIFPVGRYEAYVDGESGRLLAHGNKVMNATARAQVFPKDPVSTPDLRSRTLSKLIWVGRLESADVKVLNEDGAEVSRVDGSYVFEPTVPQFDEVQVYYAMQFTLERMSLWGYSQNFEQIPVVVHYGNRFNNAFFDGEQIVLGDGDGEQLLSLSRDNTVVTHEYGHAVIENIAGIKNITEYGDGPAVHEGHADYLACAVYDSPALGEGVFPEGGNLRRCDTNLPYSTKDFRDENGEKIDEHVAGQVWSGALWEVRQRVGAEVSDQLWLQTLLRLKPTGDYGTTTMMDMYRALLDSDRALFAGRNAKVMEQIFLRRGFPIQEKMVAMLN